MALEEDISAAIDVDLPNQIGQRLKTRLERADTEEIALKAATEELKSVQAENTTLRERAHRIDNLEGREEAVAAAEREHLQREAILDVKEKYADKGRADMFNILQAVFNGPVSAPMAFNASLYGNVNGPMGQQSASLDGSIEQKGS